MHAVKTAELAADARKLVGDAPVFVCDVARSSDVDALAAALREQRTELDGFVQSQQAVVRAIKETQAKLAGKQVVEATLTPGKAAGPTEGATGEPVPKQYEDAVAEYMRRIAQ